VEYFIVAEMAEVMIWWNEPANIFQSIMMKETLTKEFYQRKLKDMPNDCYF
jgi:hypothetical protein